jgi:MFS family permease
MVLGAAGMAASLMALCWADTLIEFAACRFLTGTSVALWGVGRLKYLADVTARSERGRALATAGGIMRISRFLSPAAGGFLAATFGLRAAFASAGALTAAGAVFLFVFVRPEPGDAGEPGGPPPHERLRSMLRQQGRALLSVGSGRLMAAMIRAGRRVIVPLYASEALGLSVDNVGVIVSLAAFVDMVMFVPAGAIMDRRGRKFAVVPCFLIQAIGMALIPVTAGFYTLLAVACLIGFGNGLGAGSMMTLGADLSPRDRRGEFLGIWRLIGDAGATGSPLVVGAVAQLSTLGCATITIAGVGFLAAAVFLFLVPETLSKG